MPNVPASPQGPDLPVDAAPESAADAAAPVPPAPPVKKRRTLKRKKLKRLPNVADLMDVKMRNGVPLLSKKDRLFYKGLPLRLSDHGAHRWRRIKLARRCSPTGCVSRKLLGTFSRVLCVDV